MLHLLVPLQVAGVRELAVADGASKGPLARMHVAVNVQLALAHKTLATELAGVRLLPGVPCQVLLQVRLQEEALGAAGAAVRPLHSDGLVEVPVGVVVEWSRSCGSGRRLAGVDGTCRPNVAISSRSVRRYLPGFCWFQPRSLTPAIVRLFVWAHPSVDDNHIQKRAFEHILANWTIQRGWYRYGASDIASCLYHLGGEVKCLVFFSGTFTSYSGCIRFRKVCSAAAISWPRVTAGVCYHLVGCTVHCTLYLDNEEVDSILRLNRLKGHIFVIN